MGRPSCISSIVAVASVITTVVLHELATSRAMSNAREPGGIYPRLMTTGPVSFLGSIISIVYHDLQ